MWGFEDKLADHHWHADGGWIQEQVAPYRLKVMLYFDPQSRDTGALRIMSGSHRSPYHDALLPWNEVHSTPEPHRADMRNVDERLAPHENLAGSADARIQQIVQRLQSARTSL